MKTTDQPSGFVVGSGVLYIEKTNILGFSVRNNTPLLNINASANLSCLIKETSMLYFNC